MENTKTELLGQQDNITTTTTTTDSIVEKTFTQEEVNKIVADRIAREKKELPTKDELEEFKKYQEDKKSQEQKVNEELETLRVAKQQLEVELSNEKQDKLLIKTNAQDVDFVKFKVSQMVTDEKDFQTCLNEFQASHPQYFTKEEGAKQVDFVQNKANELKTQEEELLKHFSAKYQ